MQVHASVCLHGCALVCVCGQENVYLYANECVSVGACMCIIRSVAVCFLSECMGVLTKTKCYHIKAQGFPYNAYLAGVSISRNRK